MAFLGQESIWAAAASECAGEQGQFWQYHDALFAHTAGRNAGVYTRDKLKQYASGLGLDSSSFNACVDSGRYETWVQSQTQQGRAKGVTSTPTLIVNGHIVSPVPDFDTLRGIITDNI